MAYFFGFFGISFLDTNAMERSPSSFGLSHLDTQLYPSRPSGRTGAEATAQFAEASGKSGEPVRGLPLPSTARYSPSYVLRCRHKSHRQRSVDRTQSAHSRTHINTSLSLAFVPFLPLRSAGVLACPLAPQAAPCALRRPRSSPLLRRPRWWRPRPLPATAAAASRLRRKWPRPRSHRWVRFLRGRSIRA